MENNFKWIPITEKEPELDTYIMVTIEYISKYRYVTITRRYKDGHYECLDGEDVKILAWCELPPVYNK